MQNVSGILKFQSNGKFQNTVINDIEQILSDGVINNQIWID